MNFPPLTRLIGGKRGVLGILKLMFMNLGNYKKPECLVFQIPAQVKEILGRFFFGGPHDKVLAPRVRFCTLGSLYLSGNLVFPRAFSFHCCIICLWLFSPSYLQFSLVLVRYLTFCWFAVFCGLPINRWCPGTLKIPGRLPLTLCLVTPPLCFAASGFLQFTYKLVVSRHPKNPGLLPLALCLVTSPLCLRLLVFCSLPINWWCPGTQKKKTGWSLLLTQLTGAYYG